MTSTPPCRSRDDADPAPFPSAEEVAFALELARLDSRELERWESDPPVDEIEPLTDAEVLAGLSVRPSAVDLLLLESIDPMALSSKAAILDYLKAAERVDAYAASVKARARVALAGVEASAELRAEVQVEHELALATRSSQYAAGMAIERSRVLTSTFPGFLTALEAGQVTEAHCKVLVEKTRTCTDRAALAAVERVTLPKARRMTPGQFGREVTKAVADHDPDATARYKAARERRAVWTRELEDGMSYLGLVHDTSTITAIKATLDTDATALRVERGGAVALLEGDEDAAMGACRADALAARVLGTTAETGDIDWTPRPADTQVQLVIDLQTLRGEADRHALLDGQPVPADIGRDLAGHATAFRRMVTDPVDGHLLDYGRITYLPAPLRTYVLARDGECRAPGCQVRDPRRTQMDHAIPFPEGPSDTANTGCLCLGHHQAKTDGRIRIEHSAPDGSGDWITAWGQCIHISARPFLHDPAEAPKDPDPPPPVEEPSF